MTPAEAFARQLLFGENRFKKRSSASAVLLGRLDPHQSKLEELIDQAALEHTFLVHLFHVRTQALFGELTNVVAKENFVFRERKQWSGSSRFLQSSFRHL